MSHKYSTIKNKHPKIHFKQYLYNAGEPVDDLSSDTLSDFEIELLDNSYFMKRRIRHIAQRMRSRYS